ncbi:DNA polymerase III subunit beta [Coxiella endosymbiont of Amblyomma americanum]|uniref:DNA polymerase III subunit beta n=1 Tax=Coxiella endosymbiont of Amblyomma americanum TaxID=325775 RepID=UPI0005806718|nr:DNA polymerase III subunit beta [Coxiella endosymbiont of Amblyomma americanum]AJC50146.1 DNA polymerase III subunit beta [Coxiella endosymbiont of Amblyomma americanum]AUJ59004.1 DNA polymerase III subunit beta [Coxiella-like endosymbiont of Amblyomma americanum]
MKLHLVRETLLKLLQQVIGVVDRKQQQKMSILSNVLLSAENNQLSVIGTDLEVELSGKIRLDSESFGSCRLTLPGKKLMDICRALPERASIELFQNKESITLRSGQSRFVLSTLPADVFPTMEKIKYRFQLVVPQYALYCLLRKTSFAIAYNDVRYYLNGLLLEVYTTKLRAVATDGHRLAVITLEVGSAIVEQRLQVILPRKGVVELLRLLVNKKDLAVLMIGSNHICVSTADFTFTSKLIEGRFPDYECVIPKNGNKQFDADRDLLKQAISRMAILCNEKFKGIRFEIHRGLLRILSHSLEQEKSEEELEINYMQEETLDIGFNVNYLLDILHVVNRGNITLTFSNSNSGVLITDSTENKIDSAFVIMPMRL